MVSGTISLPCSGFFSPFLHSTRSLSVSREYLALPDGPGRFAQDSSCPALLRIPLCCISLHILDYHRLWSHFPKCSVHDLHTMSRSYNPSHALRRHWFGLFPVRSPLLGESLLFSLPGGTKMFQFPPLASLLGRDTAEAVGCPIRKSAGQGLFAPNRGLSQLITSFIASVSQGIRHAPFLTFFSSPRRPQKSLREGSSYFQLVSVLRRHRWAARP